MIPMHKQSILLVALLAGAALAGCAEDGGENNAGDVPTGTIQQAGSSTVLPIAEAWAEELAATTNGQIQVVVAGGGSGRGASALCAGEVDIGDMSREMKQSEIDSCRANGVEPLAWKVAYDGLTVVVHPENDFVDHLTVEELHHIWRAEDPAQTWADVRAGWPDEAIVLYGPDADSGTYEYFNEVILEGEAPRSDYTPSPRDEVLVEGVAADRNAIGHFGFAYYTENQGRLRAVPIAPEEGADPVEPSFETIADGSYAPLGRPVFMVTDGAPEPGTPLHYYFEFAMNEGQEIVREVGYVELDEATLEEQRGRL